MVLFHGCTLRGHPAVGSPSPAAVGIVAGTSRHSHMLSGVSAVGLPARTVSPCGNQNKWCHIPLILPVYVPSNSYKCAGFPVLPPTPSSIKILYFYQSVGESETTPASRSFVPRYWIRTTPFNIFRISLPGRYTMAG